MKCWTGLQAPSARLFCLNRSILLRHNDGLLELAAQSSCLIDLNLPEHTLLISISSQVS